MRKKRGGATQPRKMASARPQPGRGRAFEFIPIAQLNRPTPAIAGEPRDAAQRALRTRERGDGTRLNVGASSEAQLALGP